MSTKLTDSIEVKIKPTKTNIKFSLFSNNYEIIPLKSTY